MFALHLNGGWGVKAPNLGCFCTYIAGSQGISAPFILPTQNPWFPTGPPPPSLLGGWKGLSHFFGDFKGFPTIVLILENNIRVFVVFFSGFCWKK